MSFNVHCNKRKNNYWGTTRHSRFEKVVAIDIEIHEDYRRKVLATTLTQHFVNACIQRELIPQWNCVDSNIASRNTAESIGFQLIKKKPFYWFKL